MQEKSVAAKIIDVHDDGRGVAKVDGLVYFVTGGVLGDTVLLQCTAVRKNYIEAKLLKIISPSPYRVISECEYHTICGGCVFREYSYAAQMQVKTASVMQKFKRVAGLQNFSIQKIIPAEQQNFYRNNVQLKVRWNDGQLKIGFYEKGTHRIVEIKKCFLASPIINDVLAAGKYFLEACYACEPLRKNLMQEDLDEIILRCDETETQLMIVLCKKRFSKIAPQKTFTDFCTALHTQYPGINRNALQLLFKYARTKKISVYEKDYRNVHRLLVGENYFALQVLDKRFCISPNSFFQVNTKQAEKLFTEVLAQLEANDDDTVIDLYCGVGSISLLVAPRVNKVFGIEVVEDAITAAAKNARINKIKNVEFFAGAVEKIFNKKFLSKLNNAQYKIILDPPRAGVDEKVLQLIGTAPVKKIIYVSCNPASLARDAKVLIEEGFSITDAAIVDMFPYTAHIESVFRFERK